MTRHELLKSPEYWISKIQIELFNCADRFMMKHHKNRKQLAEHLGVSKGYVTQLLNGDYDHRMSKFIELSLSFGYVPKIDFIPIEEYIAKEEYKTATLYQLYSNQIKSKQFIQAYDLIYVELRKVNGKEVVGSYGNITAATSCIAARY